MVQINVNTKKAEQFAQSWLDARNSGKLLLQDYYIKCSEEKRMAWANLRTKFFALWKDSGFDAYALPPERYPRVTSGSAFRFTAMYIAPEPTTHEIGLYVETACQTYYIPLERTVINMSQTALHTLRNLAQI